MAATAEELAGIHPLNRQGGQQRQAVPHVVYRETSCPHDDCDQPMRAIDFRLEDYGRAIPDPLVRAWWNDTGFARKCPRCGGWIHFTIRARRPIRADEAAPYPQLPDDWRTRATIL